jgi:hypothetical protein
MSRGVLLVAALLAIGFLGLPAVADAEFKAFGNGVENLFAVTIGPHPLSVVSGIQGFTIGG